MRRILFCAMLAPCLVLADETPTVTITAKKDAEWAGYRHAYSTTLFFSAYTKTRPLIQAQMQLRPHDPAMPMSGLHLELEGQTTHVKIDVDGIGRANVPLLKAAFDEDAVLRLNRRQGLYYFSGRYSVREHADGNYELAELRAACEQLIDAQRASGYRFRLIGKQCAGIKFVYPANAEAPSVTVDGKAVPVVVDHPFEDGSMGLYKVALLRFADWPATGKVVTATAPLAIGTRYD